MDLSIGHVNVNGNGHVNGVSPPSNLSSGEDSSVTVNTKTKSVKFEDNSQQSTIDVVNGNVDVDSVVVVGQTNGVSQVQNPENELIVVQKEEVRGFSFCVFNPMEIFYSVTILNLIYCMISEVSFSPS